MLLISKKIFFPFILWLFFLGSIHPLYAQSTHKNHSETNNIHIQAPALRIITLQDGSILKGEITELKDHVYAIESPLLGQLRIQESDIVSIQNIQSFYTPAANASEGKNLSPENAQFMNQVQHIQSNILSDPKLILEIQNLAQDKEFMSILLDENFMKDILSFNLYHLEENKKFKDLLNNPKIKELIEKVQIKLNSQNE